MKNYWDGEMTDEQARDLRWIIDLSRENMAARLHGHSKFGQLVAKKMARGGEENSGHG